MLSLARLRTICNRPISSSNAEEAVLALQGLASWWLRPPVLECARALEDPAIDRLLGADPPELANTPGSCWIVCRVCGDLPLLRPAVVLPLRWSPGASHSQHLPESLRRLAERVSVQVGGMKIFAPSGVNGWGLQPDPRLALDRIPLTDDLFETVESGWSSLVAGLAAALQNLDPSVSVWSSAAWDDRTGVTEVAGLAEKLGLAVEFGATVFAVPLRQRAEAEDWVVRHAPGRLTILPISSPIPLDTWTTLQTYLSTFTREPPAPSALDDELGFRRCRHYYLTQPAFSGHDQRFYRSHLQPFIAGRCRAAILAKIPTFAATHFVTIVSKSPELAVLLTQATAATHCLLLHTPDLSDAAEQCRRLLEPSVRSEPKPFSTGAGMGEDIRREIEAFTRDVPPELVAVDLKSATSKMKYWMARAARPGNWLFNLEARFLDDRRNDPGTETPELWQA